MPVVIAYIDFLLSSHSNNIQCLCSSLDQTTKTLVILVVRYLLKKRLGHGSYGEVWLAFYWNCHENHNASSWSYMNGHNSFHAILNSTEENSNHSSTNGCSAGSPDGDLFVLKRIMVIPVALRFHLLLLLGVSKDLNFCLLIFVCYS